MPALPVRAALAASAALLVAAALSACAPADVVATSPSPSAAATSTPTPIATTLPDASASPEAAVRIPTDCRVILDDAVLAQLEDIPLNDPAFGASGAQADGSLICVWGDPAADTTSLTTTITRINRGPALDLLNELVDEEDFTCYTPSDGTRCEKTWENETYPVTDGRTLFFRDDVLIDTRYSNLAPSGYTDAIIASIFG